jgi:hypothetical protein
MVGKRVVGKQNMLPLLRDLAEDERSITVVLDIEQRRYRGQISAMSAGQGSSKEYAYLMEGATDRGTPRERPVSTSALLAVKIEKVS